MTSIFRNDLMKGKRFLVTGGGTGLGREMAEDLLSLGAEVHICGRRKAVLDETAEALMGAHGGSVKTHALDIRVAEAVEETIAEIWSASGPLDGLINNAAGNFISPTKDLSPRGFDAIANIVFHGTFYMTHACGTRWIEEGRKASVVSILTTWIWNGGPFTVPSAMSKAGVNIMTKSLAAEWGRYGIRLNAIAPGPFPTKGAWERLSPGQSTDGSEGQYQGIPMGRVGEMQELRNLATFLMSDGCDYLTGQTIAIDGGGHLAGSGNFARLQELSDDDWGRMREMIRSANDKDKAARSV